MNNEDFLRELKKITVAEQAILYAFMQGLKTQKEISKNSVA